MSWNSTVDTPNYAFSTEITRSAFIRTFDRLIPEAREQLKGEPYSLFLKTGLTIFDLAEYKGQTYGHIYKTLEERMHSPLSEDPQLATTRAAVEAWAKRYNLGVPWIYACIIYLLGCWKLGHDDARFYPDAMSVQPLLSHPLDQEVFSLRLSHHFKDFQVYDPVFESEFDFKKRFRETCKRFEDDYVQLMERIASDSGFPKYPKKDHLARHAEWAVLRQVCGYSAENIAAALGFAQPSVGEGLNSIFNAIKLTPRPLKHGRPKGKETKDERRERVNAEIQRLLNPA